MHSFLFAAIIITGALGFTRQPPSKVASWVIALLTLLGIATSPDVTTRLMFVGAAILGPLLAYPAQLVVSLTIRPLLLYARWSTDGHRSLFYVTPDDPLHATAGEQLDKHAESLVSSGFTSRGRVGLRVENKTLVSEFLDRGNGTEWAILVATTPASVQPVVLHGSCTFASGDTLVVSNYVWVDPFPPSPSSGYVSIRLPSLGDVNDIVRACLTIASKSSLGPVIATPLETDVASRARERTKVRNDAEVRAGYLRYDAASDVYRLTLRGAYRMFWVSLPPVRWILERRDRKRERELLAEMRLTPAARTDSPGAAASAAPSTRKEKFLAVASVAAIIAVIVFVPDLPDLLYPQRTTPRVRPVITVPGDFAVADSFSSAVQALERLVGQPSHQLSGTRNDEPAPTTGVAISMRKDSADAFVTAVQDAFLGRGFYLFRTGERATSGLETDALALYPTRDPYVVMRAMETNASNYGMSTEDVIAWFREEEARYPIQFMVIGFDYAGGHLGGLVPDETEFARRFIRFCPDIQGEGPISAKRLGRDLKGSREIFCWWD